jgi:hypothetical protein
MYTDRVLGTATTPIELSSDEDDGAGPARAQPGVILRGRVRGTWTQFFHKLFFRDRARSAGSDEHSDGEWGVNVVGVAGGGRGAVACVCLPHALGGNGGGQR